MSFSEKRRLIKIQIESTIDKTMEKLVDNIADNLATRSPIWTGKYVSSHIVEKEAKSYPREAEVGKPPFPPKHPDPGSLRMAAEEKLKRTGKVMAREHKRVAFNNTAKHAVLVEDVYKPTQIYGVAKEAAILNKTKFAKEAKRESFKK